MLIVVIRIGSSMMYMYDDSFGSRPLQNDMYMYQQPFMAVVVYNVAANACGALDVMDPLFWTASSYITYHMVIIAVK